MSHPKGVSNPNAGRKKGSKNLKTQFRQMNFMKWGEMLTGGLMIDRAMLIMAKADDEKYMEYYMKLIEYFQPKLQRTENKVEIQNQKKIFIDFEPEEETNFPGDE